MRRGDRRAAPVTPRLARSGGRRSRADGRGWSVGDVLWLVVPVLSVVGVVGYFILSVALGASPPFAAVDGHSMRPTFDPGDLVVIRGVSADDVEKGDIVSIAIPETAQEEMHLPAGIVHRVVKIQGKGEDVTFVTKGDNNSGQDAFITRPNDIQGVVIEQIPALGYPVLFFRAQQGRIFLGALGLALVGYFLIAAIERRQEAAELESPTRAVEELGAEIQALRDVVASGVPSRVAAAELEELLADRHTDRETMLELVGAVREYGEHLRSHTQAVQSMADAAQLLASAAEEIRTAVSTGGAAGAPAAQPDDATAPESPGRDSP